MSVVVGVVCRPLRVISRVFNCLIIARPARNVGARDPGDW